MYKTYQAVGDVSAFDKKGRLFYHYSGDPGKYYLFNLPVTGRYTFLGNVTELPGKMVYLVNVPREAKNIPENVGITYTDNGVKASLTYGGGLPEPILTLDRSFIDKPLWFATFCYLHEISHFIYPSHNKRNKLTEFKCDKLAAIIMLKYGFNPSQIMAALMFILDNDSDNEFRFNEMQKFLSNVNFKYYE